MAHLHIINKDTRALNRTSQKPWCSQQLLTLTMRLYFFLSHRRFRAIPLSYLLVARACKLLKKHKIIIFLSSSCSLPPTTLSRSKNPSVGNPKSSPSKLVPPSPTRRVLLQHQVAPTTHSVTPYTNSFSSNPLADHPFSSPLPICVYRLLPFMFFSTFGTNVDKFSQLEEQEFQNLKRLWKVSVTSQDLRMIGNIWGSTVFCYFFLSDFGKRLTYRPISIETGVIAQAYGSARVKMGKTEVIPLTCRLNLLTISNITAGNKEQIQTFIEANIIGPLIHLLQNEEFDIKKEVASAISNATSGGSHDQIKWDS
ncbi:unnamed protein product [Lactuca saligna]|uniref:Exoribonuclease phosphorolytic domain-containing protein n=1 Tax=Lactuca saligna TaxID=75948 RepID=A0AA35YKF2_LACSI|nr:unnamed protein product [Lactuca saligna]